MSSRVTRALQTPAAARADQTALKQCNFERKRRQTGRKVGFVAWGYFPP